jgi:uncharacterized protein (DUF1697 family)
LSPKSPPRKTARSPGQRFVALLRAVNVGGRTIKMDELRRVFESMAFANVHTFIASGNVIFESPQPADQLEAAIERGLEKAFHYPVGTFVRTTTEMVRAAEGVPFRRGDLEGSGVYVLFLKSAPSEAATTRLMAMRSADDDYGVVGREVYWLRRRRDERLGEPFPPIGKAIDVEATMRSITTVGKIAAKYCGSDAQPPSGRIRRA